MSSLAIAGLVFGSIFGVALPAMPADRLLPASHLSSESKEVVKLGLGVVATLTAAVLGLLVASAKGTFDTQSNSIKHLSANIVLLDRLLGRFGPETKESRELPHRTGTLVLGSLCPEDASRNATLTPGAAQAEMEALYDKPARTRFRLMAPRNSTVVAVLIVCAVSISKGLFLILEPDRPFDGVMRVSSNPFREALSLIGR